MDFSHKYNFTSDLEMIYSGEDVSKKPQQNE